MLTLKDIPPPYRVSKARPTPYHFMIEPTGSPGATEYHYAGPDAPGMPHAPPSVGGGGRGMNEREQGA